MKIIKRILCVFVCALVLILPIGVSYSMAKAEQLSPTTGFEQINTPSPYASETVSYNGKIYNVVNLPSFSMSVCYYEGGMAYSQVRTYWLSVSYSVSNNSIVYGSPVFVRSTRGNSSGLLTGSTMSPYFPSTNLALVPVSSGGQVMASVAVPDNLSSVFSEAFLYNSGVVFTDMTDKKCRVEISLSDSSLSVYYWFGEDTSSALYFSFLVRSNLEISRKNTFTLYALNSFLTFSGTLKDLSPYSFLLSSGVPIEMIGYTQDEYNQYGSSQYQSGFSTGQQQGYSSGYNKGLADGVNSVSGSDLSESVKSFLFSLFDAPVNTFTSVFNIEYDGFDIGALVSFALTALVVVGILKVVL